MEDLVSHGYVVVTMDDTNESPEVEFPGIVGGAGRANDRLVVSQAFGAC